MHEQDEKLMNEKSIEIDDDYVPKHTEENKKKKRERKRCIHRGNRKSHGIREGGSQEISTQMRTFPNGVVI